jgi:hypothetical protein
VVDPESVPRLRQVVLDCADARSSAEFYRRLLGLVYRPGDEPRRREKSMSVAATGWCEKPGQFRSWPCSKSVNCRKGPGRTMFRGHNSCTST